MFDFSDQKSKTEIRHTVSDWFYCWKIVYLCSYMVMWEKRNYTSNQDEIVYPKHQRSASLWDKKLWKRLYWQYAMCLGPRESSSELKLHYWQTTEKLWFLFICDIFTWMQELALQNCMRIAKMILIIISWAPLWIQVVTRGFRRGCFIKMMIYIDRVHQIVSTIRNLICLTKSYFLNPFINL